MIKKTLIQLNKSFSVSTYNSGYYNTKTTNSYNIGRPKLPQESVDFVKNKFNLSNDSLVVDLASGPGQFTGLLPRSNFNNIIAIEPSSSFRESCEHLLNEIKRNEKPNLQFKVIDGLSTKINLKDSTVDALFISQSFHWFDNYESLAEVSRVLKKNGVLVLVWYDADIDITNENYDLIKKYTDLIHDQNYQEYNAPQFKTYKWKGIFNQLLKEQQDDPTKHQDLVNLNLNLQRFKFNHEANKEILINRALSTSVISSLPNDKKESIMNKVIQLLNTHPTTSNNNNKFNFPYNVELYWTIK